MHALPLRSFLALVAAAGVAAVVRDQGVVQKDLRHREEPAEGGVSVVRVGGGGPGRGAGPQRFLPDV